MDKIRLNPFNNVVATGKATLATRQLAGYSLHGLIFRRGGTFTTAMITGISIKVGGKALLQEITGQQLLDINEYDGLPDITGGNAHFFGDPTANTPQGKHVGDLDLSVYGPDLEIAVDIAGATAPTLEVIALAGPPKAVMPYGYSALDIARVRALVRTQLDFAGAVTNKKVEISTGSGAGALIRKIHFFHAQLTRVSLKKQSIDKHDDLTVAENTGIQSQFGRTAQAGVYTLDRIEEGNLGEAEPTLQSNGQPWNFQLGLTTGAADTIVAMADLLTLPQLV